MNIKPVIFNRNKQLLILLLFAIGLNINTLFNQYALDDPIAFTENSLVQRGIKGIPLILTKDIFYGMFKQDIPLSGGRYRPFSTIIFAIEYQLFGINPVISHAINILLFAFLIFLLFNLLHEHIFKDKELLLPFFTCLIFVLHPIHTEVIANVKSRDEIIVFILLILTTQSFIKYIDTKNIKYAMSGLIIYFVALLTRESAIPYIVIAPLLAYFFFNSTVKQSLKFILPLLGVFLVYAAIRFIVIGFDIKSDNDVLNYPFMYATPTQAFASKVYLLFKYIGLLFLPYPLISDYGYNQIPYINLSSSKFIISAATIVGLLIYSFATFNKRAIFSFCILYFFTTIILFSNFIIDIGTFLAERLLFQPSLAFCIIIAILTVHGINRNKLITLSLISVLAIIFSFITIKRNAEWKNNEMLYNTDVKKAPESVRLNYNAAYSLILKSKTENNIVLKRDYLQKAVIYNEKIFGSYLHYSPLYVNLGFAYFGLGNYFKAADNWLLAYNIEPENPAAKERIRLVSDMLFNQGNNFYRLHNYNAAITCYKKSVEVNDKNADAWYNLGKIYFMENDITNGIESWQKVKLLQPDRELDMNASNK
jgi:tetratricopeptide (TPR) repeat protein